MRLIAGDVETTGLGTTDKVVEIAWAELNDDLEVMSTTRSLVNPEKSIPPGASAVHGITDRHVAESPTIAEFMGEAGYPLAGDEIILAAHNAPFDERFFKPWAPDHVGSICTLKMARHIYPDADNHKLQTLRYYLNLDVEVAHHEAHTALADVRVLVALLQRVKRDTNWEIHEMFEFCVMPQEVTIMPFGKHKGTKLSELPASYIKWLRSLDNLDDDLRYSLERL